MERRLSEDRSRWMGEDIERGRSEMRRDGGHGVPRPTHLGFAGLLGQYFAPLDWRRGIVPQIILKWLASVGSSTRIKILTTIVGLITLTTRFVCATDGGPVMETWIVIVNRFADGWFVAAGRATWQGGLALLAAWIICRIGNRMPAGEKVWIWRLALLKLLFSFVWVAPIEIPVLPLVKSRAFPTASDSGRQERVSMPSVPTVIAETVRLRMKTILFFAWILGLSAGGVRLLRAWLRTRQLLRRSCLAGAPIVAEIQRSLAVHYGLRQAPAVWMTADEIGTFATGIFKPRIFVSSAFMNVRSAEELRMIIAHEMAHIQRWDLLWLWLIALANTLFFFHPLVHLAKRRMLLEQEIACDELALSATKVSVSAYGTLLLNILSRTRATAAGFSVSVVQTKKNLETRIRAMKKFKHDSVKRSLFVTATITGAAMLLLIPWKPVARAAQEDDPNVRQPSGQRTPVRLSDNGENAELTRLKAENEHLKKQLAELSQKSESEKQEQNAKLAGEIEATDRQFTELLKRYKWKHPVVTRTRMQLKSLLEQLPDSDPANQRTKERVEEHIRLAEALDAADRQAQEIRQKLGISSGFTDQERSIAPAMVRGDFAVLGCVMKPGRYGISDAERIDLFQALAMGGGFSRVADPTKITVLRRIDGTNATLRLNYETEVKDVTHPRFEIMPEDVVTVGERIF